MTQLYAKMANNEGDNNIRDAKVQEFWEKYQTTCRPFSSVMDRAEQKLGEKRRG